MKLLPKGAPSIPETSKADRDIERKLYVSDPMLNVYFRAGYERAKAEDENHIENILGRKDVLEQEVERLNAKLRSLTVMPPRKTRKLI